jgi:hypothetical protein
MGALFCLGLLLFWIFTLRTRYGRGAELARLLWVMYFALGASAMVIAVTDVLVPVYPPNYWSTLFLLACIAICISGFLRFNAKDVGPVVATMRHQNLIESILIGSQFCAIIFFAPFALMSLTGDAKENRLDLANKMELLGSFGLINTSAGAASQLFAVSLVLACIRVAQPVGGGRSVKRAGVLIAASLSYVVYILAYIGRDGVVYWLMTALAVFLIFRPHIPKKLRNTIVAIGAAVGAVMLLPFMLITVARFADWDHGTAWSFLEYFGAQIHTFSDYSSIERPLTLGIMNFSMFVTAGCSLVGLQCDDWSSLKGLIFEQYLAQDKEPWLFGTYVSDFVGDFGFAGTLLALSIFALICDFVCHKRGVHHTLTLSRLLLIVFLFLTPYWGIFYFRFGIINGFIIVNLVFILFVHMLQGKLRGSRLSSRTSNPHPLPATHPDITEMKPFQETNQVTP